MSASDARTQPGLTLAPLEMTAISKDLQLEVQHPFILLRGESLVGRALFDYRNTDTSLFGTDTLTNDRVRALRIGGSYTIADALEGVSLADVQASRGLDVLGASGPGDLRSNMNAPADYTKLNLELSRTQALLDGFSAYAAVSGQYSADPLLADEQFELGGPAFGSAYDPGTLAGDEDAAARAELRYDGHASVQWFPISYQAYGFYDFGAVWDKTATPDKSALADAGVDVRFCLLPHLSGVSEVAVPLTRTTGLIDKNHIPRFFFGLTADY